MATGVFGLYQWAYGLAVRLGIGLELQYHQYLVWRGTFSGTIRFRQSVFIFAQRLWIDRCAGLSRFLWVTLQISGHPKKGLVLMFILVAGLTFNMWEYFPQNAILMFLWGSVLGCGVRLAPLTALHGVPASAFYDPNRTTLASA